jgi:dihydrofolate synthase/folylpolyglutamate synthase
VHQVDEQGVRLDVQAPFGTYSDIFVPMQGTFQVENAATAVAAADVLGQYYHIPMNPEIVRAALVHHNFPGRMEAIQHNPLVLLDGAHNPHKMQALVSSMKAIYPGWTVTGILGVLGMKDVEHTLSAVLPLLRRVIFTRPQVLGKPAAQPEKLAELARAIAAATPSRELEILTAPDIQQALTLALGSLAEEEMLLVTGSLYLIGEAREYWVSKTRMLTDAQNESPNSEGAK